MVGRCNHGASTLVSQPRPAGEARLEGSTGPADELLVQAAQSGDRQAVVALYRRYVKEIYGYLLGQVGNVQDAEDLTSATFLRLVSGLAGFRARSSFRTWLYAIARNQLRDHWRRNGRRPTVVGLDEAHTPAPEPQDELEVNHRATRLGGAILEQLPDNYRRVIELRILEGRSIHDTAAELNLSPANVKVLQHRGLKRAAEIAEALAATLMEDSHGTEGA